MTYDVVYFTPQTKPKALKLYRRVSPEETKRRHIKPGTCRVRFQVKIPKQDGSFSGTVGDCFAVAEYGTAVIFDRPNPADDLLLEEIEPGLVVGNFKPDTFQKPEYVAEIQHDKVSEAAAAKQRTESTEEDAAAQEAADEARVEATRRFYIHVAHLAGVRKPSRLTATELQDIARGVTLAGDIETCSLEQWLSTFDGLEVPPKPEPQEITDPHAEAAAMVAKMVAKKVTKKHV